MMSTEDSARFNWIDLWERLRRDLTSRSGRSALLLGERVGQDWALVGGRERATIAIGCGLDLDMSVAGSRRRARQLLQGLEGVFADSGSTVLSLVEQGDGGWGDIGVAVRTGIAADVRFVSEESFTVRLGEASGPVGALELLERNCRVLRGQRGARFLSALGYPMFVPDRLRRRWMHRFGGLGELKETRGNRLEAVRVGEEYARGAGVPLQELDVLIGVLTGAIEVEGKDVVYCGTKTRCVDCPLRRGCEYGRLTERHGVREDVSSGRNLTSVILPEDRPREKLARLGAEGLSNAELLAILLRTGSGREHALEMAAGVLRAAGSLDRLAHLSLAEMTRLHGLGNVKAITIKAALELARRLAMAPGMTEGAISLSREVYERLHNYFLDRRKEQFLVLLLNSKNRVLRQVVVTEGILNQSLVHPREAFQEAIRDSASAVIFVHNHPSGDPTPSQDDRLITQRLVKAGDVVGIRVLDHVIIGRGGYFSFADEGLLRD